MNITATIPETVFEIIDNSQIKEVPKTEITLPVFLYAFASNKGEEEIRMIYGDFKKRYGSDMSFTKYGQPLLQASVTSDMGGVILAKRVVADNALLANITIVAKLTKSSVQKVNSNGELLYTNKLDGNPTTTAEGNEPIMENKCKIKFEAQSVENCKKLEEVSLKMESVFNDSEMIYPLFTISENGRGVSSKKIKIVPDYLEAKTKEYMKYKLLVMEDSQTIETIPFSLNPDIIEGGVNRSIQNVIRTYSTQLKSKVYEDYTYKFLNKVAELSGNTEEFVTANDLLFAKDRKGVDLPGIVIDYESLDAINLSYIYGLDLKSGSNGEFGETPITTKAYETALCKFFGGEFSDDIYDLDKYKIDLIIDANYPQTVKRKIESLVTFREDSMYLRDYGLNLKTLEDIVSNGFESLKNKFIADYHISYDIIDPYSKKQIPVTVGYTLSKKMIEHFKKGRNRPLAGELHNFILDDAIEGTVNFIPKVTPSYNQKDILADNRINYATYSDSKLVLQTNWTSQEEFTQLSFVNNVLAIQEVIKDVRTHCPKTRYSFIDGDDLERYKEDVQDRLNKFVNNFSKLRMVYLQDPTMVANKIFHAAIEVVHRDVVQKEYFKLYVLGK